jgi:photosystem II stability/assembly factor-like uncharacterized protein
VFKTTDGGDTWDEVGTSAPALYGVVALAIDPVTPSTLYAGTAPIACSANPCGALLKSTDGGSTWAVTGPDGPDLFGIVALAIDPSATSTIYAAVFAHGVFESTDGGETWSDINAGLTQAHVGTLVIDPLTPTRIYAGTFGGGVFALQKTEGDGGGGGSDGCSLAAHRETNWSPRLFVPMLFVVLLQAVRRRTSNSGAGFHFFRYRRT